MEKRSENEGINKNIDRSKKEPTLRKLSRFLDKAVAFKVKEYLFQEMGPLYCEEMATPETPTLDKVW